MRYLMTPLAVLLIACAALVLPAGAWADPAVAGSPSSGATDDWSVVGFGNALSGNDLDAASGKKDDIRIGEVDIHATDTNQTGFLGENLLVLDGSTNGANTISDTAFSGASGIATVIQNSGNQVLIQNATIVDVTMK